MEISTHIFLGFVLSFIGSLPLGVINLSVAETTINRGVRAAVLMSVGASFIEFLQAFIAIKFTNLFNDNLNLSTGIQYLAVPLFLGLSLYYFRQKPTVPDKEINYSGRTAFLKGILLSSINLLAIPYWIFYGTYLAGEGYLKRQDIYIFLFSVGVMAGTFVLLGCYSWLSLQVISKVEKAASFSYKFLGVIFLAFALFQIFKLAAS